MARVELREDMLDQSVKVIASRPQRWHLQHDTAQTMARSSRNAPLSTAASRSRWVAAMSRTFTRLLGGSHRSDLARLQEAEKHHLGIERQVAHLVEEDGPAVSDGEEPVLPDHRAREGAALMAEQLAQEQLAGRRAAVDDLEWRRSARALSR